MKDREERIKDSKRLVMGLTASAVVDQWEFEEGCAHGMGYQFAMHDADTFRDEGDKAARKEILRFWNKLVAILRENYTLYALKHSDDEDIRSIYEEVEAGDKGIADWAKLEEEAGITILPPDPTDPPIMNGVRTREEQLEFMKLKKQKRIAKGMIKE